MSACTAMTLRTKWACGVACIAFVAVLWTLDTVVRQVVFDNLSFDEPLVLAYISNACYFVHVPLRGVARCSGLMRQDPQGGEAASIREAVRAGLIIAPVWFIAQWTYSMGVAATSVTSSTVISTTSVVWTMLASVVFLGEKLTGMKVAGILACIAGNVVTLLGSGTKAGQREHLGGDLLCLLSAILYAAYTVVLTACTGPQTSVVVIFGTIGGAIMVAGAPLVLWLHWQVVSSMSATVAGVLVLNALFDNVLAQYAWAKAVQWTSPTTATIGLSLTIPLSIFADCTRHVALTAWTFVAAGLVVLGFILATVASKHDVSQKEERLHNVSSESGRILGAFGGPASSEVVAA